MPTSTSTGEKPSQAPGFTLPDIHEKPGYIQDLFRRIAPHYDLMNDIMTLGMHRSWKREAIRQLNLQPGSEVLDVCCGTGDLTEYIHQVTPEVRITGLDFCQPMLDIGVTRMAQKNIPATFIQGDALALPFENNRFDGVIISYGLRNVADYETCLREMVRVVKPGGRVVILDMSHPGALMNTLSGFYRFSMLPVMGKLFANDPNAYKYLSNSIYFYLSQQELCDLMSKTGLNDIHFRNKMGGICAIHRGLKP